MNTVLLLDKWSCIMDKYYLNDTFLAATYNLDILLFTELSTCTNISAYVSTFISCIIFLWMFGALATESFAKLMASCKRLSGDDTL